MRTSVPAVALAVLLLLSGCLGASLPGQSGDDGRQTPTLGTVETAPAANETLVVNRTLAGQEIDEMDAIYGVDESERSWGHTYVALSIHSGGANGTGTAAPGTETAVPGTGDTGSLDAAVALEDAATADCSWIAAESLHAALEHRLDDPRGVSVARSTDDGDAQLAAVRQTILDRDGDVAHAPSVTLDQLANATPGAVDVSIALDEGAHACRVPVTVEDRVIQQD